MKIFINPGHAPNGQPDPGACGCGLRECDISLDVGNRVKKYLEAVGNEVKVLQSDSLSEVTNVANDWLADMCVSLHCNAFNGQARGIETLVYGRGGDSEQLGYCIQEQLVATLKAIDHTIPDRGLKERPELWILKATKMPAILVEMAFIDNLQDAKLLVNDKDDIAKAVARGVTDFYA